MSTIAQLLTVIDPLPDESLIPVGFIREMVRADEEDQAEEDQEESFTPDLTLQEVAEMMGRAVSTIRGWCRKGRLKGAYKMLGRDWRVPLEALRRFQDQQRLPREPQPEGSGKAVDLGRWRKQKSEAA